MKTKKDGDVKFADIFMKVKIFRKTTFVPFANTVPLILKKYNTLKNGLLKTKCFDRIS